MTNKNDSDDLFKCIVNKNKNYFEFDIIFNHKSNFEDEMISHFSERNLNREIIDEVAPVMSYLLYDIAVNKKFYSDEKIKEINTISFYKEKAKWWCDNKKEKKDKEDKNIWEKMLILQWIEEDKKIDEIKKEIQNQIDKYYVKKAEDEQELRNKQEKEMQEANIKQLPLDVIVNKHIIELNTFNNEHKALFIDLIERLKSLYTETIEKSYQLYKDRYNTSTVVRAINKEEKKDELTSELFYYNILVGRQSSIEIFLYQVKDLLYNDLKREFIHNIDSNINTVYDIANKTYTYSSNLTAMLNFFTYNTIENKIQFLFDNFSSGDILNEVIFDNTVKVFDTIEGKIRNGNPPTKYDIITTKHSNLSGFDILFNVYLNDFSIEEEDMKTSLYNTLYSCNAYKISTLIIPLEKILERFYNVNKFSEFKVFILHIKSFINIISEVYERLCSMGM